MNETGKYQGPLSDEDVKSLTWRRIKSHFADRIEQHRTALENDISRDEADRIRGRIKELRYLMAMDEERPRPPETE